MSEDIGLDTFLQEEGLGDLGALLFEHTTLVELQSLLSSHRPLLLARLKQLGVVRLGDRQKLANSLARAEKLGRLPPATPVAHLRPCTYSEHNDVLVVRLGCEHGLRSQHVGFSCDVN